MKIRPGGPMTAEKLRAVADWLDILSDTAWKYLDLLEVEDIAQSKQILSGTEAQDDLRRWADELDS